MATTGITRSFAEIMRDVHVYRKAGGSSQVALGASIGVNDAEWDIIVNKLLATARLERSLRRFRPGQRRPSEK